MNPRREPPFDLIVITEPALAEPVEFVRRTLTFNVERRVAVQLRAKEWTRAQQLEATVKLRDLTRASDALLLINGDPQLCRDVGADGVQLPTSGPSVAEARRILGDRGWIGASCHGPEELTRASSEGADFAVLSPWGAVPKKASALGAERFRSMAVGCPLPVYALGGLTLADVGNALRHGARGIAVIRDLHHASDPAQWVRRALEAIDTAKSIR